MVGRRGDQAAGNGAAMRIAPLAFLVDTTTKEGRQQVRDVSRITHHNDEAYLGALGLVIAVRKAWLGEWRPGESLLQPVVDELPDSATKERLQILDSVENSKPLFDVAQEYGASGWVVESFPPALLATQRLHMTDFDSMLVEILKAGGDTDTIASMAAQVAGASLGFSNLPAHVTDIVGFNTVKQCASRLASIA